MVIDGKKIRQLRREDGITINRLCAIAEISKSMLCFIETNRRRANIDIIARLADYFGVTIDYLRR
ncbi:MAG: helix-turn-helix domain-containing protein [Defluviitaleaceae bacterium]|nr:helix-turn-helix domain-containing protein [Defluviitaleaceae bacterium]